MAAAPVIVESPAGDSFDMPVFLRAAETVVTSTPFLDWRPAAPAADGSARVSLATFQMCVAFVPRCVVSRIPADLAAARAVNVLIFRLEDAAWARILSELRDSNAFANAEPSLPDFHEVLRRLNPANPANLHLVANDWRAAPAPAFPGGAGPCERSDSSPSFTPCCWRTKVPRSRCTRCAPSLGQ